MTDSRRTILSIHIGGYLPVLAAFLLCHLSFHTAWAQGFFNLTAQQVAIDSVLPEFSYIHPLGPNYADSSYSVTIEYPEFIPMSEAEIQRYHSLSSSALPAMPAIEQAISVSRKQGVLQLRFVPLVVREGKYQKLVSFMLKVKGRRLAKRTLRLQAKQRARAASDRYAENSILREGTWAKIRVPSTGFYQLSNDFIRQAGFSDPAKVKIYGYGGALQPELLTASYLESTDDLKELPTCTINGKRLFYGVGPVSWSSNHRRVRNPYSDYGHYFLTESDAEPATMTEEEFLAAYYPLETDYCSLYEVDDYAWFHGGRNLYDARELKAGQGYDYTVEATGTSAVGSVTVALSAAGGAVVSVSVNDSVVGSVSISRNNNLEAMRTSTQTFSVRNLTSSNKIRVTPSSTSGTVRLDYISTYASQPRALPNWEERMPVPEYMYHITNQNHHAASAADMVIIIPTTQKVLAQAQRLKTLHQKRDGLRVNIVPADELFNEFSSGTPDATAYRRYMKMLYDKAENESDMPRFLLLLGDAAWDNRMVLADWKNTSPDDFLLCFESENSYSEVDCYVSDDYFCLLDDGEGGNMLSRDMADVAVGRITARSDEEAAIVVDKIESYVSNKEAGAWQNVLCFMGDDGNQNQHMDDADSVAKSVEMLYPNFIVKRIMWDAYTRVSSSTGNSFPDVTRLIKQQMQQGALIMNYSGHGAAYTMSHEYVVNLSDFQAATSLRLPLWVTASCDIMPFDGAEDNIGESALFNKNGGCIAFYGTTRTVYQNKNRLLNLAFTRHVLGRDSDGKPIPIGEAVRRTKNELITLRQDLDANKLQYSLLGDPALRLAIPTKGIEVDTINGVAVNTGTELTLKAGSTATVTGRVMDTEGNVDTAFNGVLTAVVRDVKEQITCKLNDTSSDGADEPFVYYDRPNTVFSGSNEVTDGRFSFSFAVPKDIKYSDLNSIINLYAVNTDKTEQANGIFDQLVLNGTAAEGGASDVGPHIYCYLNNSSFSNGDKVNNTPFFVAELSDEDGINASGSGIGHDLQLIIDGDMSKTYSLNDYFQFDFGSYTSGKIGYSIPKLDYGDHKLLFRAWDILNNSSTAELTFNVAKGLEPNLSEVECTPNPAVTQTTFRIIHDRRECEMNVKLEIFDSSGRHLWTYTSNGVTSDNTYTIKWDLTVDGGRKLPTGLYFYRVSVATEGSTYASKTKKLIILTHKT